VTSPDDVAGSKTDDVIAATTRLWIRSVYVTRHKRSSSYTACTIATCIIQYKHLSAKLSQITKTGNRVCADESSWYASNHLGQLSLAILCSRFSHAQTAKILCLRDLLFRLFHKQADRQINDMRRAYDIKPTSTETHISAEISWTLFCSATSTKHISCQSMLLLVFLICMCVCMFVSYSYCACLCCCLAGE